jgi:LytS/YehU family sensor histidine kinase
MDPVLLASLYVIGSNIASEGNLLIDKYLNKVMPWIIYERKRIYVQVILTFSWSITVAVVPFTIRFLLVEKDINIQFASFAVFTLLYAAIFLMMYNSVLIGINFFKKWKESILENEALIQEKLKADYRLLRDQLNPHFLFNCFNVLISEISYNPRAAVVFTRKLSEVYRHVLQTKDSDLVTVKEELLFTDSFIYLHKVRVGEALNVDIKVNETAMNKYLPPLTIQILIENSIKHNILSKEKPLTIKIRSVNNNYLRISNILQPKEVIESTQTGLSNIRNRYLLLGLADISVQKSDNEFIVTVPLCDK